MTDCIYIILVMAGCITALAGVAVGRGLTRPWDRMKNLKKDLGGQLTNMMRFDGHREEKNDDGKHHRYGKH